MLSLVRRPPSYSQFMVAARTCSSVSAVSGFSSLKHYETLSSSLGEGPGKDYAVPPLYAAVEKAAKTGTLTKEQVILAFTGGQVRQLANFWTFALGMSASAGVHEAIPYLAAPNSDEFGLVIEGGQLKIGRAHPALLAQLGRIVFEKFGATPVDMRKTAYHLQRLCKLKQVEEALVYQRQRGLGVLASDTEHLRLNKGNDVPVPTSSAVASSEERFRADLRGVYRRGTPITLADVVAERQVSEQYLRDHQVPKAAILYFEQSYAVARRMNPLELLGRGICMETDRGPNVMAYLDAFGPRHRADCEARGEPVSQETRTALESFMKAHETPEGEDLEDLHVAAMKNAYLQLVETEQDAQEVDEAAHEAAKQHAACQEGIREELGLFADNSEPMSLSHMFATHRV
ncbi:MAG: hypothetical protein V4623_04920 [Pseudomonadota bacterium]